MAVGIQQPGISTSVGRIRSTSRFSVVLMCGLIGSDRPGFAATSAERTELRTR